MKYSAAFYAAASLEGAKRYGPLSLFGVKYEKSDVCADAAKDNAGTHKTKHTMGYAFTTKRPASSNARNVLIQQSKGVLVLSSLIYPYLIYGWEQ